MQRLGLSEALISSEGGGEGWRLGRGHQKRGARVERVERWSWTQCIGYQPIAAAPYVSTVYGLRTIYFMVLTREARISKLFYYLL